MAGPPPPPAGSARWSIRGHTADTTSWELGWHLELLGASGYDYASVHELHELLLIWSEPFFSHVCASEVTPDVSRLTVTGPASSVGDQLFLFSHGSRGPAVPAAIAVPVRQIVAAPGRGRSGRFFLPPPAFADTNFSWQLTAGAASTYSSELALFFNGVNAISTASFPNVRFAVIHRRQAGAWLVSAQIQPVETWVLSRVLGTQDRRMSQVQPH